MAIILAKGQPTRRSKLARTATDCDSMPYAVCPVGVVSKESILSSGFALCVQLEVVNNVLIVVAVVAHVGCWTSCGLAVVAN